MDKCIELITRLYQGIDHNTRPLDMFVINYVAYKYFSEQETDSLSIEATYQVCVGENSALCPEGSVRLQCGASIAEWAAKECASYDMSMVSGVPGGRCGYSVAKIVCKSKLQAPGVR